jgi:hypothetical protein
VFLVGQTEPTVELPRPNSKPAMDMHRAWESGQPRARGGAGDQGAQLSEQLVPVRTLLCVGACVGLCWGLV